METEIVLVKPIYQGNVGAVARVMKNFGFTKLALVEPCKLGDWARAMASHAQDVLEAARFTTLDDIFHSSHLAIGTTGIVRPHSNLRTPYPLAELGPKLSGMRGAAAILFGSEDQGLSNGVLRRCDMIINIRTSPAYPIMNISHAVAIILHSIAPTPLTSQGNRGVATHMELSWLLQHTADVLEAIDFPHHKRQRVLSNLKRIYGRSELSPKEVRMLRGILRRIELGLRK